jgi:hypothetical protein
MDLPAIRRDIAKAKTDYARGELLAYLIRQSRNRGNMGDETGRIEYLQAHHAVYVNGGNNER